MSKKVSFYESAIVKTISEICPKGTYCHNEECKYEHPKDTIRRESLNNSNKKKVKEVEL